jgi:hypothetical protein
MRRFVLLSFNYEKRTIQKMVAESASPLVEPRKPVTQSRATSRHGRTLPKSIQVGDQTFQGERSRTPTMKTTCLICKAVNPAQAHRCHNCGTVNGSGASTCSASSSSPVTVNGIAVKCDCAWNEGYESTCSMTLANALISRQNGQADRPQGSV